MIYELSDFDSVPSVKDTVTSNLKVADLPTIEQVRALANWSTDLLELFDRPYDANFDRSASLARIAHRGAELAWDDEQIMAALMDADERWGKYAKRRDRKQRLIDLINRARQVHGYGGIELPMLGGFGKPRDVPQDAPVEQSPSIVYGYQDFLGADFHIDWLLEGLFAQGGLGLVTGFPGTGKTQFCLQVAHYLALGRSDFLKWHNADGPRKVMFLSLEMGANPLHLFLTTISQEYSGDHETLQRNLSLVPLGTPIPLDTKDGQAFMNALLDEYQPDILVIDSLQKVISSELSNEQSVKSLIHYLSVTRQKYKCSMLVIHHNRKKPNDAQKKGEVELSDVYGSTYITTDVDFVLSLRTVNSTTLTVDMLKNRLGPQVTQFEIYRNPNLSFTLDFEDFQARFRTVTIGDDDDTDGEPDSGQEDEDAESAEDPRVRTDILGV